MDGWVSGRVESTRPPSTINIFHGHRILLCVFFFCRYISMSLIIIAVVITVVAMIAYRYIHKRIQQKALQAKIARRQARRQLDDNPDREAAV